MSGSALWETSRKTPRYKISFAVSLLSEVGGMETNRARFKRYRVKATIHAVKRDRRGVEEFVTIYPGTNVLVTSEERQSGMVDVLADGEFVSVLRRELEEYGDQTA
jgi:hypothetical protein